MSEGTCPSCGKALDADRLPHDEAAEAALLGAMLLEEDAVWLAAENLVPTDFHRLGHQEIFQALCEIYDSGQRPDEIILCERLRRKKRLGKAGATEYVRSLTKAVPPPGNAEHYTRIIGDRSRARSLITACIATIAEAEEAADMDKVLDRAEERIYDVASRRCGVVAFGLKDILSDEFMIALECRMGEPELITGMPTGFKELDRMTGGLQAVELVVLAGRPGVGMTSLALGIVEHVACNEEMPALIFSLATARSRIGMRLLSLHCEVPHDRLVRGGITKADFASIVDSGMGRLRESQLFIDDTPAIGVMELRAKARRMKSRYDIGLVIVDRLSLVSAKEPGGATRNARTVGALKTLARELRVPVLVLLQIEPPAGSGDSRAPGLDDLRAAGVPEWDIDTAMVLHRDRDESGRYAGAASLAVVQQRNGPCGRVALTFDEEHLRFRPSEPTEE